MVKKESKRKRDVKVSDESQSFDEQIRKKNILLKEEEDQIMTTDYRWIDIE